MDNITNMLCETYHVGRALRPQPPYGSRARNEHPPAATTGKRCCRNFGGGYRSGGSRPRPNLRRHCVGHCFCSIRLMKNRRTLVMVVVVVGARFAPGTGSALWNTRGTPRRFGHRRTRVNMTRTNYLLSPASSSSGKLPRSIFPFHPIV